jgi:hypothetical protein
MSDDEAPEVETPEEEAEEQLEPPKEAGVKRTRSASIKGPPAKRKLGRPKKVPNKNDHLILTPYTIVDPPVAFEKVDRQSFFNKITYTRRQGVPATHAPSICIEPGMIVLLWNYGKTPFVIKALYTSGKTINYKLVGSLLIGGLREELPECHNPKVSSVPSKHVEQPVADITHIFVLRLPEDPANYPSKKRQLITDRKRDYLKVSQQRLHVAKINFLVVGQGHRGEA